MSEKDAQVLEQGTKVQSKFHGSEEWRMVCALDEKRALEKYAQQLESLSKGTLNMPGFFKQLSGPMMQKILYTIETTKDEKLRVSAAQDILDRAGHGKISKAVVAHQDLGFENTKRELINSVMSLAKKAGIKVKEESYVEGDGDVVDVDVVDSELPDRKK